jgi:hypothetical protein
MELGEIYESRGEIPRKCVVVWVNGCAYGSIYWTPMMERLVGRFGPRAAFLWVARFHLVKWMNRLYGELTYSQW